MQLVPYLTAAFQQYAEDGTPPFRALVLDAPEDKRLYTVDDQYMIGDRMMVAPLFAGEPSRKVVIPQGSGTTSGPARQSLVAQSCLSPLQWIEFRYM